ncbi:hypothetical protein TARUN_6415 [Trichoderma arundinaceum]|uniref:Uncharacterized protein n=1 Tax=Trichoderma arundinaceum TaxID=490622 RepID=A0A395NJ44_TRIAR|nr:hypothetical protein TARUN_6415 [Trichoderma arundinaceum]
MSPALAVRPSFSGREQPPPPLQGVSLHRRPRAATRTLAHLSPEIILHFMECLPDIATLKSVIRLNKRFYEIFNTHRKGAVLLSVLSNELGEDLSLHAIVVHQVEKLGLALPAFDEVSLDGIDAAVDNLRKVRDQVVGLQGSSVRHWSFEISIQDADRMSILAKKISQLSIAFEKDCRTGMSLEFYPLQDSVRYRPITKAEMTRIKQSMYMFQIFCLFCKNSYLDIKLDDDHLQVDRQTLAACVHKISHLQNRLASQFLAPWELYQVISLQAWFRRASRDLGLTFFTENEWYLSERITPFILAQGIDTMHMGICTLDDKKRHGAYDATTILKLKASTHAAHGLGMILSRGDRDGWARTAPGTFEDYKPFLPQKDDEGYRQWRFISTRAATPGPLGAAAPAYDMMGVTEGMLDTWSAALWDSRRWFEMRRTIDERMHPDPWNRITWHWDAFHVGWRSALDFDMLDGVGHRDGIRTFIVRWIKVLFGRG